MSSYGVLVSLARNRGTSRYLTEVQHHQHCQLHFSFCQNVTTTINPYQSYNAIAHSVNAIESNSYNKTTIQQQRLKTDEQTTKQKILTDKQTI